jgi:two-component system sensor histidine kinase ResE
MIRKSIIFKLWISILTLMLIAIIFLGTFFGKFLEDVYNYFETSSLVTRASHIAEVIVFREDKQLATEIIWELSREINASVVIDTKWESIGTIVTGPRIEDIPENVKFSDEQIERVYNGEIVVQQGVIEGRTEILAAAVPLINKKREIFGIVSIYKPSQKITEFINQANMLIVYTGTIAFLLSILLAFYLTKRISDPLIQMNEIAQSMAEGRFNGNIEVKTDDEIGTLGRTMNALAIELDSTIQSLNKEKEQVNSILISMSDAVITIDKEKVIVLANPPATKLLKRWIPLYRLELNYNINRLPSELFNILTEAFDKQQISNQDVSIDGRTYAVATDPLYFQERFNGLVAVIRDITEEKQMDKLRKDFVANVSHELRTPLSMLQGYSEALLDDFADDPKIRRELVEVIFDESIRMKTLVNDLLDLAKLEARQIVLDKTTVDIKEMLENLVKRYRRLHTNKNFYIETKYDHVYLYIDIDRIQQVFINLIDNAVRHTDDDGEIEIKIVIEDTVKIELSDNGVGIPDEDVPFIFERFYKADKARTRSKSGTGLGLAISKNIIESHMGDISIKSKLGQGTTFIIELPKLGE